MQQTNQFKLEQQNDITWLYIQGDITAQSESVINDAYKEANDQGPVKKILIQFDKDHKYKINRKAELKRKIRGDKTE